MSWGKLCLVIFTLGAYHGINPAMGWLFAAARGLQTQSRTILAYSLVALSLGHLTAIIFVLALVAGLGLALPFPFLTVCVALALIVLGGYQLVRTKHPGWFGMQIGILGLFGWSFVMATAHGAGLMLLLFLMNSAGVGHQHALSVTGPFSLTISEFAFILSLHTLGYLFAAAGLSFLVCEKFGIHFLKTTWINFDLLWAMTLLVTGGFVLVFFVL